MQWQYSASIIESISWSFVILAGTFLNDWNQVNSIDFSFQYSWTWFQWINKIPTNNNVARKHRIIKGIVILVVVSVFCLLLGYFISAIPANWSPNCYNRTGTEIVCPNMSLPSIPFVQPKTDIVTIWTMAQWFPSLTIHLAVSHLIENRIC